MVKSVQQTRDSQELPQPDKKASMKNPMTSVILNGKRMLCPKDQESRQWCLLSPLLFNTALKILASVIRQEKEMKGI